MELSTYFRINAANSGQFERTLIVADEGSYVSYLEGCTAPQRDENQLHAAVVELVALKDAQIKYSTVQNWYPGDAEGKGGIYNFVTKRGDCRGANSKISWTQVETGSAITWKYPSCVLTGDNSVGEFYSVAIVNNRQQADTGSKMIHIGKNTKSTIISKGISAGKGQNTYRGLVKVLPKAKGARNFTQCDSLLIGDQCGAHTVPYIDVYNRTARVEHEATTSKVSEDQMFYCRQRGLSAEDALVADRQRLRQGSAEGAADGIRRRGAEAARDQPGRQRRLTPPPKEIRDLRNDMLEIKNLHARVEDNEILKGISLTVKPGEVHAIMGPNGSGKSTLASVLSGRDGYEVTEGSVTYLGQDLLELDADVRAREGVFLAFQYPVEIPGVNNMYFLRAAVNAVRKHRGEPELDAGQFLQDRAPDAEAPGPARGSAATARSMSGSPAARRSATRSSRWRC